MAAPVATPPEHAPLYVPAAPSPRPHPLAAAPGGLRPEIQALRAIAVALVIAYHAWPDAVPGGFVGVDVFFAISGFLISAALLRELDRSGKISLSSFWARRVRRLLPGALMVLALCAIATLIFVPIARWAQFLDELRASVFYVQNWQLASSSVDYFAAAESPSPVQHYWTLAVEEQFYVVWPLLLLAAVWVARRVGLTLRFAIVMSVSIVSAASFIYAIGETRGEPAAAYFSTPARAWEFGFGALLALAVGSLRSPAVWRAVVSALGLAAIVAAALLYSNQTPFPGAAALLPVLGTLAVIWAGMPAGRFSPAHVLGRRPLQVLGDISYSAYLWHWPLLILSTFVFGITLGTWGTLAAVGLTLVLAWLSTRYIEDPVRYGRLTGLPPRRTFLAAVVGMLVVVGLTTFGDERLDHELDASAKETQKVVNADPRCFGAASRDPAKPCVNPALDLKVVPTPAEARLSTNAPCDIIERGARLRACAFGATTGSGETVAVVGDSHASAWRGAVDVAAQRRGWRGVSITYTGCAFSTAIPAVSTRQRELCQQWRKETFAWFAKHSEVKTVFVIGLAGGSGVVSRGRDEMTVRTDGLLDAWKRLPPTVERIIVIRDNPKAGKGADDCVEDAMAAKEPAGPACAIPRSEALDPDPAVLAAQRSGSTRVRVVDLTERFCDERQCFPVVGGALVHRDQDHVNPVFARTLGAPLDAKLASIGL
ncbi:MAG: acyltransferase [Solirubrobacteraceae bacterium]|nr:acyltransferase [Solirubrobacteraceae bacterium]